MMWVSVPVQIRPDYCVSVCVCESACVHAALADMIV